MSRKVVSIYLVLFLLTSVLVSLSTTSDHNDEVIVREKQFVESRRMLEIQEDEELLRQEQRPKKTSSSTTTSASSPAKNKTKLIKPSTKNQTKLLKPRNSTTAKLSNLSNIPKSELKQSFFHVAAVGPTAPVDAIKHLYPEARGPPVKPHSNPCTNIPGSPPSGHCPSPPS